jgi:hypothetical protein
LAVVRSCPAAGTATKADEAAAENIFNKARRIEHAPALYPLVTANRTPSSAFHSIKRSMTLQQEHHTAHAEDQRSNEAAAVLAKRIEAGDTHKQQGDSITDRTAYDALGYKERLYSLCIERRYMSLGRGLLSARDKEHDLPTVA